MRRFLHIMFWLVITSGVMVLLGFVLSEQKKSLCRGLEIHLADANRPGFVMASDIEKIIRDLYDPLEGQLLDSINISLIYVRLNSNPYLKNVHVYKSLSGKIKVEAERNEALIRVVPEVGESFYLSKEGVAMPLHNSFLPHLRIASGIFHEKPVYKTKNYGIASDQDPLKPAGEISSVYRIAVALERFPVLNKHIEQIYFNARGEFELVPVSGDHLILLGTCDSLHHKLENLLAFYQAGRKELKPEAYKIIDLRFMNQVICKKSIQ